jgi:hypothetical protein
MIHGNRAIGGRGGDGGGSGNGGNGGQGSGGGIRARGTMSVAHTRLVLNQATGGAGGDRGAGGLLGGNGGLGAGGGVAGDLGSTGTVSHTSLVENQASGGAGGVGATAATVRAAASGMGLRIPWTALPPRSPSFKARSSTTALTAVLPGARAAPASGRAAASTSSPAEPCAWTW